LLILRFLYSSSPKKKPGPKGPSAELIGALCELKRRNPRFGCPKIAQHLAKTFASDTPDEKSGNPGPHGATLERYAWRSHCHGLFELPIAA
jgi:hypothetical protein